MDSLAVFIYSHFVKWKEFGVDTSSLATKFNQYSPLSVKQGSVITLFWWRGRTCKLRKTVQAAGASSKFRALSVLGDSKGFERLSCADGRAGCCS